MLVSKMMYKSSRYYSVLPSPRQDAQQTTIYTILYILHTTNNNNNILTVGAPGFSKMIVEHLASIHSLNNFGLSAVRPLINAHRGCWGSGKSLTAVPNVVPYLEVEESAHSLNSGPPGPVDPPPRNHGSIM